MQPEEALDIHKQLWAQPRPTEVKYRDEELSVYIANQPGRIFRRVNIVDENVFIITQNMAKPSTNTKWVEEEEGRSLSWIFKHDNYAGRIRGWIEGGEERFTVEKLNPDELVLKV